MTVSIEELISGLALLGVCIGAWVQSNMKIRALEIKVDRQEKLEDKNDKQFSAIMENITDLKQSTAEKFGELHTLYREVLIEIAKPKNR